MTLRNFAVALLAAAPALSLASSGPIPGWWLTGSNAEDYSVALDRSQAHTGVTSAALTSMSATPRGFGGLMQTASAQRYKGKRIKFTAHLKTAGVRKWSGLWLRVDGQNGPPGLAFDNMQDRPVVGDTEWQEYSVVLDVSEEATNIAYGVLLEGPGKVWFDSAGIEVVAKSVPTTGKPQPKPPREPTNLDFEQ